MNSLLALQALPLQIVTTAGCVAALYRDNYVLLKSLLVDPQVRENGIARPVVVEIGYPSAFTNASIDAAEALVLEAEGNDLTDELLNAIVRNQRQRHYTPASDLMSMLIRRYFTDLFGDDSELEESFDRLEAMMSLLATDCEIELRSARQYFSGGWIGSFGWRDRWRKPTTLDRIQSELSEQGEDWAVLRAGLFGRSQERAQTALDALQPRVAEVRDRWW
jgi:hypothetical protein